MSDSTDTTPPEPTSTEKPKLDQQLRLRCTPEEKAHFESAQKDAGYKTLSDYLRPMLLDRHVLIVGDSQTEFTLVPAFSSAPEEREEAMLQIQGLLQLGQAYAQATQTQPAATPAEPAPDLADGGVPATPAAAPPVGAPVAAPPQEHLAAVPAPAPLLAQIVGPTPLPHENYEAFFGRRKQELRQLGRSDMVAGYEAEAEWRAFNDAQVTEVDVNPALASADAALAANEAGHGFCGNCGKPLAGTAFCSACGTPTGL